MIIHRPHDMPGVELLTGAPAGGQSLRHMHEAYTFGLALDGSWSARYDGTGHRIGRGTVQLAQPGAISECEMGPGPSAFLTLSCPAALVDDLAREVWGPRSGTPTFAEHAVVDAEAAARLRRAHRSLLSVPDLLERSGLLIDVTVAMLAGFAGSRATPRARPSAAAEVARVRQVIDDDPSADPSVAELATLAGMSPFHFSRVFRKSFGLAPHAYRLHRRVERAKALLAAGETSGDVAHRLGFADQSHLIRQFRRQTGLTPAAYARAVTT